MDNFDVCTFFLVEAAVLAVMLIIINKMRKIHKNNEQLSDMKKWYTMAMTDNLTQIQNRAAYSQHIAKLQADGGDKYRTIWLIIFDIDDFKKINDSEGHLAGDEVLQKVAAMLMGIFSDKNYGVYRIGGDEFAVVAEKATEDEIINKLLELRNEEKNGDIRLSKGYALVAGKKSFNEAFAEADEMLYADKLGKNFKIQNK